MTKQEILTRAAKRADFFYEKMTGMNPTNKPDTPDLRFDHTFWLNLYHASIYDFACRVWPAPTDDP